MERLSIAECDSSLNPQALHNTTDFNNIIKNSHDRSHEYGVPQFLLHASEETRLSPTRLRLRIKQNSRLISILKHQIGLIRKVLDDSSSCAAIADADGYILYVEGSGPVMEHFKSRRCLPGYRWLEEDMGTCSIGLAIAEKHPVLLQGYEMYNFNAQHVTNSAVPIFNRFNELQCVLSLSGFADKVHTHTLGMLLLVAENVCLQMEIEKKAAEYEMYSEYLWALEESFQRGIITLDRKGEIVRLNTKAKSLLQLSVEHIGWSIDQFIKPSSSIAHYLKKGEGFQDREVAFKINEVESSHVASLDPLVQNNIVVGGILSITEQSKAMKLANTIAGDQALFTFSAIVGESRCMLKAKRTAYSMARSDAAILLQGETGTGKELFAQSIHNASPRKNGSFVALNCGAIPKKLFESELFGYEEGAFTGARKGGRPGKLEMAHEGTLFLDEIGDMPFEMQVKLLRALQSGTIHRLGSTRSIKLNFRVIVATNADLKSAIKSKEFRQDLYYRINTLTLGIPPLRERGADIILLANTFLQRYNKSTRNKFYLSKPTHDFLMAYPWPGNIRQLENCIERAVALAETHCINPKDLGLDLTEITVSMPSSANLSLAAIEKKHIKNLLSLHPSISKVARILKISRPTLYRKMKEYNLSTYNGK